ncbi:MAG: hypothetical protein IKH98_07095 [Candidatus Methanomethylophilaceae archaeon]|nr:hypothetical protein [Candidatus Methanomethylophilaceae archaeon]
MYNKGGNDPVENDFVDKDTPKITASFSSNYSGLFGEDYYLIDSVAEGVGTANHPNGQEGHTHNYVTFIIEDSKEKAKSEFNSLKDMNSKHDGLAVSIKGGFEDAAGVYNNVNDSGYMFYTGYLGNAFFESYAYVDGKSITEDDIATFVATSTTPSPTLCPSTRPSASEKDAAKRESPKDEHQKPRLSVCMTGSRIEQRTGRGAYILILGRPPAIHAE